VDSRVSWVVVQGGHSGTGNSLFYQIWSERLRNVRLAALDLEEDLMVDLGVSGQNRGFIESQVSL